MAKVAERPADPVAVDPIVTVRVTKAGDGKISNGVHHPMLGDEYFERGEEFAVARSIAEALEVRAYAEIVEARPAPEPVEHVHVPADYEEQPLAHLDHDKDGKPGGSMPRRGRPPKSA